MAISLVSFLFGNGTQTFYHSSLPATWLGSSACLPTCSACLPAYFSGLPVARRPASAATALPGAPPPCAAAPSRCTAPWALCWAGAAPTTAWRNTCPRRRAQRS